MTSLERPAFYALRRGGWRDLVTVLHLPYTAWNLANVGIGAALAPHLYPGRLLAALAAFFLAAALLIASLVVAQSVRPGARQAPERPAASH